jgi:hypothetical protein
MKPIAQKITVIIVFLLVIIFGIGQFFGRIPISGNKSTDQNTPAAPTSTPTQVVRYTPPISASSTTVAKGSCWTSSIAAPYRTDAWRCAVGNGIQDPCFQINGSTSTLFCGMDPADPTATSSFVLSLTKSLPKASSSSIPEIPSNWAWLVELEDGTICSPFTGTLPFAADQEVAEYGCAPKVSGGPAWDIFGDLNASSGVWTAKIGMFSASTSTFPPAIIASSVVPIAEVWQ